MNIVRMPNGSIEYVNNLKDVTDLLEKVCPDLSEAVQQVITDQEEQCKENWEFEDAEGYERANEGLYSAITEALDVLCNLQEYLGVSRLNREHIKSVVQNLINVLSNAEGM